LGVVVDGLHFSVGRQNRLVVLPAKALQISALACFSMSGDIDGAGRAGFDTINDVALLGV